MATVTLYCYRRLMPAHQRLTLAYLHHHLTQINITLAWIALEPRAALPRIDQQPRRGRIAGLTVLSRQLPSGLDDLPLLSASLYGQDQWVHLHDAHPLSQLPGQILRWSLRPINDEEVQPVSAEVRVESTQVLLWQDRQRFGLPNDESLPNELTVQHFIRHGRRIAWRLLPS